MANQLEIKDLPVDGFQEKVFDMLYHFQQEDYMCDAVIFGRDGSVPAHKIVLMASSEFFREKIVNRENYFCESVFYLHDYFVTDIENVIRLFYTGRLMFDRQRIGIFTKLCKELHLSGIVKTCQEILIKDHMKVLEHASHLYQKYRKDKEGVYDNISDVSSVPSHSEEESNGKGQNTIHDSSLIYKSAKSLSELYGLPTRGLKYSLSDQLPELDSKTGNHGNAQVSNTKPEKGKISCEAFPLNRGVLQSKHRNMMCENDTDLGKDKVDVPKDCGTEESHPVKENSLTDSMCSCKPLTGLSEDMNLSESSELSSPFYRDRLQNDYSTSGSDKLTDSSNVFSDTDNFKSKFQCNFCSKNFALRKELIKHKIKNHGCNISSYKQSVATIIRKLKHRQKYQNRKKCKRKGTMKQHVRKKITQKADAGKTRDGNVKSLCKTEPKIQNGCKAVTGLKNNKNKQETVKNNSLNLENNGRHEISVVENQNLNSTVADQITSEQQSIKESNAHLKSTNKKTEKTSNVRDEIFTSFTDRLKTNRTCVVPEDTVDNNVKGEIVGTCDDTMDEVTTPNDMKNDNCNVSNDTSRMICDTESTGKICNVTDNSGSAFANTESLEKTCIVTEECDKGKNDMKFTASKVQDTVNTDTTFYDTEDTEKASSLTKDKDETCLDIVDTDRTHDTPDSECTYILSDNLGGMIKNTKLEGETAVHTENTDGKVHTKKPCDDKEHVDNISSDTTNSEKINQVTKNIDTAQMKNMEESSNGPEFAKYKEKPAFDSDSNKKSLELGDIIENAEYTEKTKVFKIDKLKTKNCSPSKEKNSRSKEIQSKGQQKKLKKLNSKHKEEMMKPKKGNGFDQQSPMSSNKLENKMSKKRKLKLLDLNNMTSKKTKKDIDDKRNETEICEHNKEDENADKTKNESFTKQQEDDADVKKYEKCSNVSSMDISQNQNSHRKHGDVTHKAPREESLRKLKPKQKPRQSFEDAIGMIYDYSFYKRKKIRRSDSRSLAPPATQQNLIIKTSSTQMEESSKPFKEQESSSYADGKQKSSDFKCRFCKKVFKSQMDLKSHEIIHTSNNIYTCKVCSKLFDNKQKFQNHVITHSKKGSYFCGICNKEYRKLGSLRMHFKEECGKETFRCSKCQEEFSLKENLIAHQVTHGDQSSLTCHICQQQFHTILVLRMHMKNHAEWYECDICCKKFNSIYYLNLHKKHHESQAEDNFWCDICDLNFNKKIDIAKHVEEHRNQKIRSEKMKSKETNITEKCPKNKQSALDNLNLENASQNDIITDEDKHIDDCELIKGQSSPSIQTTSVIYAGEEYMDEETLKESKEISSERNQTNKGETSNGKKRNFGIRGKIASNNNKEKESVIGRGSFWCYKCDFFFPDEKLLRKHTMLHTDERPFKCDICPNSFFRRSELKRHKLTCGITYKCDICSEEFRKNSELKSHKIKFHNHGEKKEDLKTVNTSDQHKPYKKQIVEKIEKEDAMSKSNKADTNKELEFEFQEDGRKNNSDRNDGKEMQTSANIMSGEEKDLNFVEESQNNITSFVSELEMEKMKSAVVKIVPLNENLS